MSGKTMQAIQVHQYGGPEELILEQIPRPEPQTGEVLVRVHAVGVLPMEWKIRSGLAHSIYPAKFPYTPGSAIAGVVDEVGPGVTTVEKGQAVFGRTNYGAYAEYTRASVETLALKPEKVSFAAAASISGGATVAWTALFDCGELQSGQRVLIHGAAGGVGSFAVQFARWKGAHVIGTASTANVKFVRSLGAETIIDYTTTPFEQVVHDVDMVLETIGGENMQRSMQVVRSGGMLISLLEQPDQEKAQELGIRATQNWVSLPFPSTSLLQTIAQLMAEGKVTATVEKIFPLHEANLAHKLNQSGHGRGRIVLRVVE